MSKHTPGPWEIDSPTMAGQTRIVIASYGFGSVAAISRDGAPIYQDRLPAADPYHQAQIPTMEANARLIAAAPKMLEALREALSWVGYYCRGVTGADVITNKLEAAIKEAESEVGK